MNACSHLFVCMGVNQQRSSKCSSVSCNCCVLDCSSEFFCTYAGQKPEVPRSFFFLQRAGVLWGLVAFCGCWDGRSFFCHRTSCPMDVALAFPWIWLQPMVGGSTPPWSVFISGLRCFLGRFCGLEVASDLLWTSGKRIGAVIFYHHHHHHLQQHQYSKKIHKA